MSVLSMLLWDTADAEIKGEAIRRRQKRLENVSKRSYTRTRQIDDIGQRQTPVKDRQVGDRQTRRERQRWVAGGGGGGGGGKGERKYPSPAII